MEINDRIEAMLIQYLKTEHNIEAIGASFGYTEGPYNDGCDTCGYGCTEMSFDIIYNIKDQRYGSHISIDGDPLGFFPTLLKYDLR